MIYQNQLKNKNVLKTAKYLIMEHQLKTWKEYFILSGIGCKTFEIRKHDRNFRINDIVILKEYDPQTKEYTGRTLYRQIIYVYTTKDCSDFGLKKGYCILGIR